MPVTPAMDEQQQLNSIREEIDALDEQIQTLITRRAKCAMDVAEIKRRLEPDANDFYRPEREARVLRMVRERNNNDVLDDATMTRLFRQIISASLALQMPLKVAYLGPQGTFTQDAALQQFGESVKLTPLELTHKVFREVEAGEANYGVVPVENSTEGAVNQTLDMFMSSPLLICGEVSLRIHHQLMSNAPTLDAIDKVYGHAQSLAQCRQWLAEHLPQIQQPQRVEVSSTAEAARIASTTDGAAAIASETAAHIYGLRILARNIEDDPNNTTRFLVIGRKAVAASGRDKTSLLLSTPNRAGALHDVLSLIAKHGVNMTRIESRPSRRAAWNYVFFIDIEGHQGDEAVVNVCQELEAGGFLIRVLGSYPASSI